MEYEIEIAGDNPAPHRLTFNGKPVEESDVHAQDGRGVRTYCYGLAHQSNITTRFSGPYVIDIATRENAIIVSFTAQADPAQSVSLSMPIRQWGPAIRKRDHLVSEYDRTLKEWRTTKEGAEGGANPRQAFEDANMARRNHHNASASELMEEAKFLGIHMDHETARDLFAVVAGLTHDLMPSRGNGVGGPGAA